MTDLLSLNEGKTLEFKRDPSSPKNLLKMLVAAVYAACFGKLRKWVFLRPKSLRSACECGLSFP
jgi:hypothetical protein